MEKMGELISADVRRPGEQAESFAGKLHFLSAQLSFGGHYGRALLLSGHKQFKCNMETAAATKLFAQVKITQL